MFEAFFLSSTPGVIYLVRPRLGLHARLSPHSIPFTIRWAVWLCGCEAVEACERSGAAVARSGHRRLGVASRDWWRRCACNSIRGWFHDTAVGLYLTAWRCAWNSPNTKHARFPEWQYFCAPFLRITYILNVRSLMWTWICHLCWMYTPNDIWQLNVPMLCLSLVKASLTSNCCLRLSHSFSDAGGKFVAAACPAAVWTIILFQRRLTMMLFILIDTCMIYRRIRLHTAGVCPIDS